MQRVDIQEAILKGIKRAENDNTRPFYRIVSKYIFKTLKDSHYKIVKMRQYHNWKCQKCGLIFGTILEGEPILCPICKDKGCKSFEGIEYK